MAICYVYCDYKDQTSQTDRHLFVSLAKQSIQQQNDIPDEYNARIPLLYELINIQQQVPGRCSICITSREIHSVQEQLHGPIRLVIRVDDEDIGLVSIHAFMTIRGLPLPVTSELIQFLPTTWSRNWWRKLKECKESIRASLSSLTADSDNPAKQVSAAAPASRPPGKSN